jgi:hypothetical protein
MAGLNPAQLNNPQPIRRSPQPIKGSPSFGSNKLLTTLGKSGNDAGLVTMSTSLAIMALRPIVIMMDKNASKDEKVYAAAWIFALSAVGFGMQALLKRPFDRLAGTIAKNVLKLTGKKAQGAAEMVKFGLFNIAAVGYTYLNSRYVGRVMDFLSNKFTGKPFNKDKKELTPEQKKKEKKTDRVIYSILGSIAAFVGLNVIGRKLTGRPIASDALANGFKKMHGFLTKNSSVYNSLKTRMKNFGDKLAVWANKPEMAGKIAAQADAGGSWITRNMMANAIVRPIISLLSGQPYVAIRCLIDEGIGILAMKGIGRPLANASIKPLAKMFKGPLNPTEMQGVKTLAEQLVMNVGVLCIALGFFNNAFSKKVVEFMNRFTKDDKANEQNEKDYKDFRKNFIPAMGLNDNIRVQSATNPQEWLLAINDPVQTQTAEQVIRGFSQKQYRV